MSLPIFHPFHTRLIKGVNFFGHPSVASLGSRKPAEPLPPLGNLHPIRLLAESKHPEKGK